jgi:DnaJ-class molecular chaperone
MLPDEFEDDEEETTSPDHKRASVICPRCGGGMLPNKKTCALCNGQLRIDKETYKRWRKRKR